MLSLSDKKRNRLSPLSPCPHIIYYHHKTRRFSICADVIYVIALETVFILPIGAAEDAAVITTGAAGAAPAPMAAGAPITTADAITPPALITTADAVPAIPEIPVETAAAGAAPLPVTTTVTADAAAILPITDAVVTAAMAAAPAAPEITVRPISPVTGAVFGMETTLVTGTASSQP